MGRERCISYLRVSTDRQGRSGLGLEAQRRAVDAFLLGSDWKLLSEFVEVESGRRADRPQLAEAVALCRAHRAALIVAKVDRLARSQAFLSRLLEAGIEVRFCDLPQIEGPTGRFLLQSMMAVAELEAGMISARTKAALAASKARGKKLGGFRGRAGTSIDTAAARAARARAANERAEALAPILARIDPFSSAPLRTVAALLTAEEIPTPSGRGTWTASTVVRVRARLMTIATVE